MKGKRWTCSQQPSLVFTAGSILATIYVQYINLAKGVTFPIAPLMAWGTFDTHCVCTSCKFIWKAGKLVMSKCVKMIFLHPPPPPLCLSTSLVQLIYDLWCPQTGLTEPAECYSSQRITFSHLPPFHHIKSTGWPGRKADRMKWQRMEASVQNEERQRIQKFPS